MWPHPSASTILSTEQRREKQPPVPQGFLMETGGLHVSTPSTYDRGSTESSYSESFKHTQKDVCRESTGVKMQENTGKSNEMFRTQGEGADSNAPGATPQRHPVCHYTGCHRPGENGEHSNFPPHPKENMKHILSYSHQIPMKHMTSWLTLQNPKKSVLSWPWKFNPLEKSLQKVKYPQTKKQSISLT